MFKVKVARSSDIQKFGVRNGVVDLGRTKRKAVNDGDLVKLKPEEAKKIYNYDITEGVYKYNI